LEETVPVIHLQLAVTVDSEAAKVIAEVLGPALRQLTSEPLEGPKFVGEKPLLIGVAEAAKLLGVSERTIGRMREGGGMPPPVKILRSVRWSREALMKWVADGCPRAGN
jgi:excisionase family DNA binding protein